MSYHNDDNQEKCWSCEFFCGERKRKSGIFLGNSTETSKTGTCSCRNSSHFNKTVFDTNWCSKYQKWGVIASSIAEKESQERLRKQKLENAKYEQELKAEQERAEKQRRELERERYALEWERRKLEYERWYASLSQEDKERENRRIEQEKARQAREAEERRIRYEQEKARQAREAEERRIRCEQENREKEEQRKLKAELDKRKRKNKIIIGACLGIIFVLMLIFGIKSCYDKKAEEERIIKSNLIYEYSYSMGGYVISAGSQYECPTDFIIPSKYEGKDVVAIKEKGFRHQKNLMSLTIPATIRYIGNGAFKGCSNINSVSIPFTGNTAGDGKKFNVIFGGYDSDTKNIKNLVYTGNYISEKAFQNCSFESVTLTNVTYIGNYAFDSNPIKEIILPNTLEGIGGLAFRNSKLKSINIPKNVKTIGVGAFYWNRLLTSITVDPDNNYFCSQDNLLMSADKKILYTYPGGKTDVNISIPSTIEEIKADAFSGNKYVEKVSFNNGLKIIGNYIFMGCDALKEIYVPDTVTSIGYQIFDKNVGNITLNYDGIQSQWNEIKFKKNQIDSLNGTTLKFMK